jgi:hypothetical protein
MIINALLSDDKEHVLVFYENQDEPEEYTVSEFSETFGEESLAKLQEEFKRAHRASPDAHEVFVYYDAFLKFLKVNGKYVHDLKLYSSSFDGSEHANKVVEEYFDSSSEKLMSQVLSLKTQHTAAINSLNFWLERVGLEPIPTRSDGNTVPSNRLAIEDLTNLFHFNRLIRERMMEKVKKHQREGILYSPEEILEETLLSFRKVKSESKGTSLQKLIKTANKVL